MILIKIFTKKLLFNLLSFFWNIFELLGISLVLPAITIVTKGDYEFNLGLGIDDELNNFISDLNSYRIICFSLADIVINLYYKRILSVLFEDFITENFLIFSSGNFNNNIYKNYLYQDQLFHLGRNSSDLLE